MMTGTATGLMLMPASVVQAIVSPFLGKLLDLKGGKFVMLPATLLLLISLGCMWAFFGLHTHTLILTVLFTLMAVAVSACITGETHGLNALPYDLNPHGASTITTLNPIAGAIGAAFFVGITSIGEKMSSGASSQAAMLNGIHLAMVCALAVAILSVIFALKIKKNKWHK